MKRKLISTTKIWDYGFGIEVKTGNHGWPERVKNKNAEVYNLYSQGGHLIKELLKEDDDSHIAYRTDESRQLSYLVHIDSLQTTVIWKHKATLLNGLPDVIGKRYREEKRKWVLLLRAAKEMNVAIAAGEVVGRILRETGVTNREGFVINVRKLHRAVPLLSMDKKTSNVQEIMFRIYVNFMAKNDPNNAELSFDNTENWYKKNGWRVPFVSNTENKTLNEMIFGHILPGTKTLQQLMDEMDAKLVRDKKDLCDKLSSGSQDVTVINQKITPVKHMDDGGETIDFRKHTKEDIARITKEDF